MSALPSKADIIPDRGNVRCVPRADIRHCNGARMVWSRHPLRSRFTKAETVLQDPETWLPPEGRPLRTVMADA